MRAKSLALLTAAAIALGGCGDDEGSETTAEEPTSGASYDITAAEFIAATDKKQILGDFAADNPECQGAVDDGFVIDMSVRATELPPDDPIGPEILDACTLE